MNAPGRASGKVILLGEHAVVYGTPALAAGLEQGASAEAELAETDSVFFDGIELAAEHELYAALGALRRALGAPPVRLNLRLEIPAGSGLGASAALGVASARALSGLSGHASSDQGLLSAVNEWERVFHGNPSGVDAAAARGPRVLRFVRGQEPEPILVRRPFVLCVAVAAPPAPTRQMVENVATLRRSHPENFEKTLLGIESLVDNATLCLRSGDLPGLGKLMDLNQMLLASWMVSSTAIERACHSARLAGAWGAKLTGSGGGGCVIALAGEEPERILSAWRQEGLTCFSCHVGKRSES